MLLLLSFRLIDNGLKKALYVRGRTALHRIGVGEKFGRLLDDAVFGSSDLTADLAKQESHRVAVRLLRQQTR